MINESFDLNFGPYIVNDASLRLRYAPYITNGDRHETQFLERHGAHWKLIHTKNGRFHNFYLHVEKSGPEWHIATEVYCSMELGTPTITNADFGPDCNEVPIYRIRDDEFFNFRAFRCSVEILPKEAPVEEDQKQEKLIDFSETQKYADIVVEVEGKEFNVNKATLGHFSAKFEQIFENAPADQNRFTVDLISADQFQLILEVILFKQDITGDNALEVLETAWLLGISKFQDKAMKAMIPEVPHSKRILLADRLGIDQLMDSTLALLTTTSQVRAALPKNLDDLKESTVRKLLQKMATSRDEPIRPYYHQSLRRPANDNDNRDRFLEDRRMRGGPNR